MYLNEWTEKLERFVVENTNKNKKSIKSMKPNLNSHFKQGYFNVAESKKYADVRPCIYRSSSEFKFMYWLENCPRVKAWVSEPFSIVYYLEDGTKRTYSIDFIVLFDTGKFWFTEVKPYGQTIRGSYDFEMNKKKWNAAIRWCKENDEDIEFKLITERFRMII